MRTLFSDMLLVLVLFGGGAAAAHWFLHPTPTFSGKVTAQHQHEKFFLVEKYRRDVGRIALEVFKGDTAESRTAEPIYLDIHPLVDLVDEALDTIGVRGVYEQVFGTYQLVVAYNDAARETGFSNSFKASLRKGDQGLSEKYVGMRNVEMGSAWWLRHWLGAITADKLLRDGSLRLDDKTEDRLHDAPAFMKELQRMMRVKHPDILPFHAQHAFDWHLVSTTRPDMDKYPMDLAEAFCGDLLENDEYVEHVNNDIGRECRHGFGHAVYYVLARRQLGHQPVNLQFRTASGFTLSDENICTAYKICDKAPTNDKTKQQCRGGFRHSWWMVELGNFTKEWEEEAERARKRCDSMLFPGEELSAVNKPSFIYSPNREYKFGMAPDGDLSLWHQQDPNVTVKVWSAGTCCKGRNAHVELQKSDGNLVVYSILNETKKALWDSKIISEKGTVLEIGNDGKARVFNNDLGSILRPRTVLWESE